LLVGLVEIAVVGGVIHGNDPVLEVATLTLASTLFKVCRAIQLDQASPDFNGKGRREAAPYCSQARRCRQSEIASD
jgi:hypothetical protein